MAAAIWIVQQPRNPEGRGYSGPQFQSFTEGAAVDRPQGRTSGLRSLVATEPRSVPGIVRGLIDPDVQVIHDHNTIISQVSEEMKQRNRFGFVLGVPTSRYADRSRQCVVVIGEECEFTDEVELHELLGRFDCRHLLGNRGQRNIRDCDEAAQSALSVSAAGQLRTDLAKRFYQLGPGTAIGEILRRQRHPAA